MTTARRVRTLAVSLFLAVIASAVVAQIKIPKKLPRIPGLDRVPGLDRFLGKEPPVTTSLSDALTEVPFLDDYNPGFPMSLGHAVRNDEGVFTLRPGTYMYEAQSYCLKAGTYGPGRGEGYLYAPLKGPKGEIVRSILRRSIAKPNIPQRDIQYLLWAIIARAKLSQMPPQMQATAAQLLTPKEIFDLNGGALGLIPDEVRQQAYANLPDSVRQVMEAENKIRQMVSQVNATFADLERVAVLVGEPPVEAGDRTDLPRRRWSYHPEGYFIRFDPLSYPQTSVEVSVPDWHEVVRDDAGRITRISDRHGRRIEASYEPSRKPAGLPLRAGSFASVRFVNTRGNSASTVAKWDKSGWVLSGVPGEGTEVAGETLKMTDVSERVALTKQRKNDIDELIQSLEPRGRGRDKKRPDSSAAVRDLLDLASFHDALRALASKRAESEPAVGEFLEVVQGAWQASLVQSASPGGRSSAGGSSSGSASGGASGSTVDPDTEFDPSGNVGVPGQTGRQRLGQSARCKEDCGCDRRVLCKDLNAARESAADLSRAVGLGDALKKLKQDFCDNPAGQAQIDRMSATLRSGGPNAFQQIRWQINDLMDQTGCLRPPECPVTAATTIVCPHGGVARGLPSPSSGSARGVPLLSPTDVVVVQGCPFTVNGQPSPCMNVLWVGGMTPELSCHSVGIALNGKGVPQGPVMIIPQSY